MTRVENITGAVPTGTHKITSVAALSNNYTIAKLQKISKRLSSKNCKGRPSHKFCFEITAAG